ncbi:MAG TPA: hypothetical protein VIY30_06110, partial [Burkholderiaceae bacterium]
FIHLDRPDVVIESILDVVERSRQASKSTTLPASRGDWATELLERARSIEGRVSVTRKVVRRP